MSNFPLVSIIVPTHNRPHFLKKTIQSILSQTYLSWELLVVSNGFNEENKGIVESFGDQRIYYIEQENSGGPASPRNHGCRLARGKYIAFCDDDDLWMPGKLKKQVDVLENNPGFGVCYTDMKRFDEIHEWIEPKDNGPADLDSLLYVNTVPISSVIIRKTLLKKYGGFTENSIVGYSEDYDFILRYSNYTKLFHLNDLLVKYWSGTGRTSLKSEIFSVTHNIKYLKGILGCYYLQFRANRIELKKLILPAWWQIKIIVKIIAYNVLKELKIIGRPNE